MKTKAVTPNELQETLGENQVVVSYFVGERKLYIFVITPNEFEVIDLQKPSDFESLVRDFMRGVIQHQFDLFTQKGYALHKLLIAPVRDFIVDDFALEEEELRQVFIIPHGVLTYLPFESLIGELPSSSLLPIGLEAAPKNYQSLDYLLLHCEVSYHYSATLLHRHLLQKENKIEMPDSFGGFAPIYDTSVSSKKLTTNTANVAGLEAFDVLNKSAKKMQRWASRSGAIRSDGTWVSLPHSETEAVGVAELFAEKNLESKTFCERRQVRRISQKRPKSLSFCWWQRMGW